MEQFGTRRFGESFTRADTGNVTWPLPRPRTPFVVAHRAGNCLRRLRSAETMGVEVVEADLRLYRGKVEVRHLNTLGPIPILWDIWALGNPFAPRLRLEQLLVALESDTQVMLDLKGRNYRLGEMVLRELPAHLHRNLTVCARNWRQLEPFLDHPEIRVVHSVGNRFQLKALQKRALPARLHGVSVRASLLTPASAKLLTQRAEVIMAWPVNSAEQARRLMGWGVQGFITDFPDRMARFLRSLPQASA